MAAEAKAEGTMTLRLLYIDSYWTETARERFKDSVIIHHVSERKTRTMKAPNETPSYQKDSHCKNPPFSAVKLCLQRNFYIIGRITHELFNTSRWTRPCRFRLCVQDVLFHQKFSAKHGSTADDPLVWEVEIRSKIGNFCYQRPVLFEKLSWVLKNTPFGPECDVDQS